MSTSDIKSSGIQEIPLEGINFISFFPFSENFYRYCINSIDDNSHIIKRELTSRLIAGIRPKLTIDIFEMTRRFQAFIFINKWVVEKLSEYSTKSKEMTSTRVLGTILPFSEDNADIKEILDQEYHDRLKIPQESPKTLRSMWEDHTQKSGLLYEKHERFLQLAFPGRNFQ
jgi:hypothetical protein